MARAAVNVPHMMTEPKQMTDNSSGGLSTVITETTLRRMAGGRSFGRGADYFDEGAVRTLRIDGGVITARIRGTREYKVRLRARDGELDWSCTCPVGDRGEFCKHGVAVGLAWIFDNHDTKEDDAPSFGAADVGAFLLGLDKEELVSLLLARAEEDDRLYRALATRAARAKGGGPNLSVWMEALEDAVETHGYVQYNEAYDYYSGIEEVIDSIEGLLKDEHASAVVELAEYGLKALERSMEYVDDSDGWMGGLLDRLQDLHLSACRMAKPDSRALAKRLFAWEMETDFDTFHGAANAYADVLGDEGLEAYRQLAETAWAKISELSPGADDPDRYGGRYRITAIMETLARMTGDIDRLVDVGSRDLSTPYQFLNIAEIYKEAGKQDLALRWAERGWKAFSGNRRDGRLREFIADAYHHQGRHDEAVALSWGAFEERPTSDAYELLKRHAKKARRWPEWRVKALTLIRNRIASGKKPGQTSEYWQGNAFTNRSVLVEIFLSERDVESAWEEAAAGGCSEALWLMLAKKREKTHPAESIKIYRGHVSRVLRHANKNAYREAVDYLGKIRELLTASDRDSEFEALLTEIRHTHRRKRNLMKMLDGKPW